MLGGRGHGADYATFQAINIASVRSKDTSCSSTHGRDRLSPWACTELVVLSGLEPIGAVLFQISRKQSRPMAGPLPFSMYEV
jgi:hypothetical protein